MVTLKVPKAYKEQLQKIGISLAWGDKEKAIQVIKENHENFKS